MYLRLGRPPSTSDAAKGGGGGELKLNLFENAPEDGVAKKYQTHEFEVQFRTRAKNIIRYVPQIALNIFLHIVITKPVISIVYWNKRD